MEEKQDAPKMSKYLMIGKTIQLRDAFEKIYDESYNQASVIVSGKYKLNKNELEILRGLCAKGLDITENNLAELDNNLAEERIEENSR